MKTTFAFLAGLLLAAGTATAGPFCGGRNLLGEGADAARLAAAVEAKAEKTNADAVFWKIEVPGRDVPPSWLLGTIHLTDDRVTNLPPATRDAFDGARILAVENTTALKPNPGGADLQVMIQNSMYTDGRTLRSVLSEAEIDDLMAALKARGLPGWAFLSWKPWAVIFSALAYPPCEMQRLVKLDPFLDALLVRDMEATGRPVTSLEEFGEQLGAMSEIPEDLQVGMLRASLKVEPMQADLHETMVQLYLEGRVGAILGLSKALIALQDPGRDYDPFWASTLNVRNLRMLDHAKPLIEEGNAFLAVGAGHLIGEGGLVALLRKAGYRVSAVARAP